MILSRLPVRAGAARAVAVAGRSGRPQHAEDAARGRRPDLVRAAARHDDDLQYNSQDAARGAGRGVRAHHAEACGRAFDDRARSDSGDPFQAQPHTVSAILTGDFNLRPEDPLHARMTAPSVDPRAPAFADTWQFLHPGRRQAADPRRPRSRTVAEPFACDFIFATSDLCPRLWTVEVDATTAAS